MALFRIAKGVFTPRDHPGDVCTADRRVPRHVPCCSEFLEQRIEVPIDATPCSVADHSYLMSKYGVFRVDITEVDTEGLRELLSRRIAPVLVQKPEYFFPKDIG